MEKIRFVEFIRQQVEAGNVDSACEQHWYNEGAEYTGPTYRVRIKTKLFTRRKVVELMRFQSPYYHYLDFTPEERQVLIDLLPKAIEVRIKKRAESEAAHRKEMEALEWWP